MSCSNILSLSIFNKRVHLENAFPAENAVSAVMQIEVENLWLNEMMALESSGTTSFLKPSRKYLQPDKTKYWTKHRRCKAIVYVDLVVTRSEGHNSRKASQGGRRLSTDDGGMGPFWRIHVFSRVALQRRFHWTLVYIAYICITQSDWPTDPSLPEKVDPTFFPAGNGADATDGPTMHLESTQCKVTEIRRRTDVNVT